MAHVTNQNPEYDFHENKQIEEEKKKYHTKKASNRNGLFDIPTNSKKLNKNATGNAYDFLYFSTLTSFDFRCIFASVIFICVVLNNFEKNCMIKKEFAEMPTGNRL